MRKTNWKIYEKAEEEEFRLFLEIGKKLSGINNHHNTGEQRKRDQEDHRHTIGKDW
ncbi:MAG: hypothetical protein QXL17_01275 [Candidatus Thermoplasmatota archaeon]